MLKKIIIVLVVLALLGAGGLIVLLTQANSLINSQKGEIERLAASYLGAPVEIGQMQVEFLPPVSLRVNDFRIRGTESAGLSLKGFLVEFALGPLLRKRLEVARLELIQPSVLLVKDAEGVHIPGIHLKKESQKASAQPATHPQKEEPVRAEKGGLALTLDRLAVSGGRVEFRDDKGSAPIVASGIDVFSSIALLGQDLAVRALTAKATLEQGMPLELEAPEIALKGDVLEIASLLLKIRNEPVKLSGTYNLAAKAGEFKLESPGLGLKSLEAYFPPALKDLNLVGALAPGIQLKLLSDKDFSFHGTVGLKDVSLQKQKLALSGTNGVVSVSGNAGAQQATTTGLNFAFNNAPAALSFTAALSPATLNLEQLQLKIFGGSLAGTVSLGLKETKPLATQMELKSINFQELFAATNPDLSQKFSGRIESVEAKLTGSTSALPASLSGSLRVDVRDGALKGVNVAQVVLKAINNLPLITGAVSGSPGGSQNQQQLNENDTSFRSLTGDFAVGGSRLQTNNLLLVGPVYQLQGDGSIGFDSELDFNATLVFTPEFSASIVGSVKQLKGALDSQGRLIVPLTLKGKPPKVIVLPNLEKLLQTGLGRQLEEKATKALDNVLTGKKGKGLGGILGF